MSKKRTTLDSLFAVEAEEATPEKQEVVPSSTRRKRTGVKHQTVYLPDAVHEQLRRLAFEERAKMHDYLLEGLDRVFQNRGLPSIKDVLEEDSPVS